MDSMVKTLMTFEIKMISYKFVLKKMNIIWVATSHLQIHADEKYNVSHMPDVAFLLGYLKIEIKIIFE